jgi:hypothetical protein
MLLMKEGRRRLTRSEAAAYMSERADQHISPDTLRGWPVPYRQLGRDAMYEIADLDRFIEERFAAAPVRINRAAVGRRTS